MKEPAAHPSEDLRPLGDTGLYVHPICLGCAELGSMPEAFEYSVSEEDALRTLRACLASPINFLDTAASYGNGESERRIGVMLREVGGVPPGAVIATKADRDLKTGDFSGDQIRRSVERSLRLLGVDRLQLVYLHDPEYASFDTIMAPGGAVDVLRRCKEEGLIEHLGVAGGPIPLMIRYVETGMFEAAISHNRYTLLNVSADPFWDACAKHGVAAVNAAPYGSGILAKGPRNYPRYAYQVVEGDLLDRALRLQETCDRHGVSLAAAALQFSMRDPRIVSTVVGASKPARIAQTLNLARMPLPPEIWAELAEVAPTLEDPEAHRFT